MRRLYPLFFCYCLIICFASFPSPVSSEDSGYFVIRSGSSFTLNGKPFYFNGTNNDHLYHWSHFMIDDVLNDSRGLGLTVFRTWASSEGQNSWKDGFCFQPDPGVYDEPTFQQMDYIIARARENGIRLILPLVNNWDDGFGGMQQYVKWSLGDPGDWSGKTTLTFDLYNDGDAATADVAIRTGWNWVWHESMPYTLQHGWNYNITYDLTAANWKTAASNWEYTSMIAYLDNVKSIDVGVFGYAHPGFVYIDNIRLDSTLYDGLEKSDNWSATDYSYGQKTELSSEQVSQGSHSLKMSYSYCAGEYNKAFAQGKPAVDKNLFYTDPVCRQLFKDYIYHILTRVNTITGMTYKDDPTILMWELANEPRCESDQSGDTLYEWAEHMAGYIKSIDTNHLVSTGEEGYYRIPGSGDWRHDGRLGTDYIRNNSSIYIDAASFHLYPEGYGMTDAESLAWIQEHINDAHNVIGKPVYLGEYGITADRKAAIFNDFDSDTEGWIVDWHYSEGPTCVESPCRDANGSIRMKANIGPTNTSNAARIIYADPGIDYSKYDYFSGWVYLPVEAPPDLTAELYIRTGPGWAWASGSNVPLVPGQWTQVKLTNSQVWGWGADLSAVRCLGIQVKRANTDYTGYVYYDNIGANLKGIYDAAYQSSRRDQLYSDWFGALDVGDANGAAFWQIFARQDDGTLFPDYWNWGVYYPEDAKTSTILRRFSWLMSKNFTPMVDIVSSGIAVNFGPIYGIWMYGAGAWTQFHRISPYLTVSGNLDADPGQDLILDFGPQYGIHIYYNNSAWMQLHTLSSDSITAADMDGNGIDDIIVDFGTPYGLWMHDDKGHWWQLHILSP